MFSIVFHAFAKRRNFQILRKGHLISRFLICVFIHLCIIPSSFFVFFLEPLLDPRWDDFKLICLQKVRFWTPLRPSWNPKSADTGLRSRWSVLFRKLNRRLLKISPPPYPQVGPNWVARKRPRWSGNPKFRFFSPFAASQNEDRKSSDFRGPRIPEKAGKSDPGVSK